MEGTQKSDRALGVCVVDLQAWVAASKDDFEQVLKFEICS